MLMEILDAKWMLIPMAIQVAMTLFTYRITWNRRVSAVRNNEMDPLYFKTKSVGEATHHVKAADELLLNLFENTVIFYAGCITAIALDSVDAILIAIASIYVIGRILHANEMLGKNSIRRRFRPWVVSLFCLGFFWAWLLVRAFVL